MNAEKCKACPHVAYMGGSRRCMLVVGDVLTGTAKACSMVRAAECKKAREDYAAGLYKSVVDGEIQGTASEIIAKARARNTAEKKAKEEKKTCGTCKHYPVNPVRNPAKMEACGVYKIAVREGGKACPDWEARA